MSLLTKAIRGQAFDGNASLNQGQRLLGEKTLEEMLNARLPMVSDSDASVGGAATETMKVEGLKIGDIVTSVAQVVAGAAVSVLEYAAVTVDGELNVTWSADPTAGAIVRVTFIKG